MAFGLNTVQGQDYALTFEKLETLQKEDPKPVIVFLHAPWCNFCENMKQTSFQDEAIKQLLTKDFHFVSFDGESKEDVTFLGNTFKYKPTGANTGTHELAEQLGGKDGVVSYPTIVFLNKQYEILYQNDGFLSAKQLKKVLRKML
ncbi:thioredoxin fold domain-containing protein [Roseivirga sp. E12]|uniref:thioredoxin family protein n=1 Tax=Roseivirga sp. E12 TaxID=2819237 RepID=UPI001ABC72AD|nr:thioredoxin fold domain-containing protein [Roseivirga sp. E12]MBO3699171.1 thioredoxin fold domain-containing protein [Roseivirga sp. E12]